MLNNHPYDTLDYFHMIGMPAHRDPAGLNKNLSLSQGQDRLYAHYGIACWRVNNITLKNLVTHLPPYFSGVLIKVKTFSAPRTNSFTVTTTSQLN